MKAGLLTGTIVGLLIPAAAADSFGQEFSDELLACRDQVANCQSVLDGQADDFLQGLQGLELRRDTLQEDVQRLLSQRGELILSISRFSGVSAWLQSPQLRELIDVLSERSEPTTFTGGTEQERQLLTNLVFGMAEVAYEPELPPDGSRRVTLQFTPYAVLSDDLLGRFLPNDTIDRWYVRAEYQPAQLSGRYLLSESGRQPEQRELQLLGGRQETWVWEVDGERGFEIDTSSLVFYVGYQAADGSRGEIDVSLGPVEWMEGPGWWTQRWLAIRGVGNWIQNTLLGLFALATAWLKFKAQKD